MTDGIRYKVLGCAACRPYTDLRESEESLGELGASETDILTRKHACG